MNPTTNGRKDEEHERTRRKRVCSSRVSVFIRIWWGFNFEYIHLGAEFLILSRGYEEFTMWKMNLGVKVRKSSVKYENLGRFDRGCRDG